MTVSQEQLQPDWLTPLSIKRRGRPKKPSKVYKNMGEIVSSAIYWAERNEAKLPPHPSSLREKKQFQIWVKNKGYYAIIFSHVWAKKFYGDASYCTCRDIVHEGTCWEYHLKMQLLYREQGRQAPLKYIAKFGL